VSFTGAMELSPQIDPPSNPKVGQIYHDSSSAICAFLAGNWEKIGGAGDCNPGMLAPQSLSYEINHDLKLNDEIIPIVPTFIGDYFTSFSISPDVTTHLFK
jgi:hypothetical protein